MPQSSARDFRDQNNLAVGPKFSGQSVLEDFAVDSDGHVGFDKFSEAGVFDVQLSDQGADGEGFHVERIEAAGKVAHA